MFRQPPCPNSSSDGSGIVVVENDKEIFRFEKLWPYFLIQDDEKTLKLFPSNVEPWADTPILNEEVDLSKIDRINIIHDVSVFGKTGRTWILSNVKFHAGQPSILSFTSTKKPSDDELRVLAKREKREKRWQSWKSKK